jgi:RNA polymerase sigma-70 factor (ECF subfamily)
VFVDRPIERWRLVLLRARMLERAGMIDRWPNPFAGPHIRLFGRGIGPGADANGGLIIGTTRARAGASGPENPHAERADRVVQDVDARHGQQLLGLAIRSGLSRDAAEDAVQEALLRLWLEIRKGIDIIEPRAWAFRTLYRLAMDEHRFRRRASDAVAQLSTRSWRALDPDVAERISIWALVDQLPTRQRQVLYLRYKADLSFDQVGSAMGITASAARAHATFAADRLRRAIGQGWDE